MQYTTSSENYSSFKNGPSKWNDKDDKGGYIYKKSSYQYSGAGDNNNVYGDVSVDKNIDQLDALLEDLKTERQNTRDKDILTSNTNYRTIERGEGIQPNGSIIETKRIITTSKNAGGSQVLSNADNFLPTDPLNSNVYATLKSSMQYEKQSKQDRPYGSENIYESNTKINGGLGLSDNTEMQQTMNVSSSRLENDLQNIPLSDDILPLPGTKVITTVRTYTYEVPADMSMSRTQTLNTKHNTLQQKSDISSVQYPSSPVHKPQTVIYNTESISTINRKNEHPIVTNKIYELREQEETNTIHNSFPNQQRIPPNDGPNGTTSSIVYKINTTNNIQNQHPAVPPNDQVPPNFHMPYDSGTSQYYYKESTNSVNTIRGPGHPNDQTYLPNSPTVLSHKPSPTNYPRHIDDNPHTSPNTSTMTYKYSTTSTTNSQRGPEYGRPQSPNDSYQLSPFPVDGMYLPPNSGNSNPPQKVDDLMQTFDNTDGMNRVDMETPHRKREIETSVATSNPQYIPSVNRAGKDIYYPPGHEIMLNKREEMMASGSSGGGRWAKGSGMYEYESGYKSKSKTKTGGAMVPVCLPLCCAMPCSIM